MPLISLLKQLRNARVLVIGDLMLDHYVWGDVHRISPEAPVPVVHVSRDTYTAGGAANVALNLTNLGVQTTVLGQLAADDAGERLLGILNNSGIKLLRLPNQSEAPTIIKTRVIVRNQQLCRIDREGPREMYRIDNAAGFDALLDDALADVNAVIISDYAKGVVTQTMIDRLMQVSKNRTDLLISIDPKPSGRLSISGAGLLTPNRSEAIELAGLTEPLVGNRYPLEQICQRINELYNPKLLIITLGAEGMAICEKGKVIEHLPTAAQQVFDVSGAGDTVIATLTAAISLGASPAVAARLANAAAGCVVAHVGTSPVEYKELYSWLKLANEKL